MTEFLNRAMRSLTAQIVVALSVMSVPWLLIGIGALALTVWQAQQQALEAVIKQAGANAGQINVLTTKVDDVKEKELPAIDHRIDRIEDRVNIISGRGEIVPVPGIPGRPAR